MPKSKAELGLLIDSLSARIEAQRGRGQQALDALAGRTDEVSVAARLAILLDEKKYADGVTLVLGLQPSVRWCSQAVAACCAVGNTAQAKELIAWAKCQTDEHVYPRSVAAYSVQTISRLTERHGPYLRPGAMVPADLESLGELLRVTQTIANNILDRGELRTEVEYRIAEAVTLACYLLPRPDSIPKWVVQLKPWKPIPLLVANMVLQGYADASMDIVDRLRLEHPADDLESRLLAALIEGARLGRADAAMEAAKALMPFVQTDVTAKRGIVRVFLELAQASGPDHFPHVSEVAKSLLPPGDRFLRQIEALVVAVQGNAARAKVLIQDCVDDGDAFGLQVAAKIAEQCGEQEVAVGYLKAAARQTGAASIYQTLADLAWGLGQYTECRDALKHVAELHPGNASVLKKLCAVYANLEDWTAVSQVCSRLIVIEPSSLDHLANAAIANMKAGNLLEAIRMHESLESRSSSGAQHIVAHASLLHGAGRASEAMSLLRNHRKEFWEEPAFVQAYLTIAHAADADREGGEAMAQLRHLQQIGKAGPEVFEAKSLDDLVSYVKESRERADELSLMVAKGEIPWVLADCHQGLPAVLGWRIRTQPLDWIIEEPKSRAAYSVYATNACVVRADACPGHPLPKIMPPSKGSDIVLDMSALITLHRIGLLDRLSRYFGRVLYPSDYRESRLWDQTHLMPHQSSTGRATESIHNAIERREIIVLDSGNSPGEYAVLDEYGETPQSYGLLDAIGLLRKSGLLDAAQLEEVNRVAHRAMSHDAARPVLAIGGVVRVDLQTLMSLAQVGVLSPFLQGFQIALTAAERSEVVANLNYHRELAVLRGSYEEMSRGLDGNGSFMPTIVRRDQRANGQDGSEPDITKRVAIGGMELALQEGLPLLADDRVCQTCMLNDVRGGSDRAFGTPEFLDAAADRQLVTEDELCDVFLRMLEWRYRFIVLPPEVLVTLAVRYRSSLPGAKLKSVALYIHECMRDAGLPLVAVKENVPSVGIQLYARWLDVIADSLAMAWSSGKLTEHEAELYTCWAVKELVPTIPPGADAAWRRMAAESPRVLLAHLLFSLCSHNNVDQAHRCVCSFGQACGWDMPQLMAETAEVINAI